MVQQKQGPIDRMFRFENGAILSHRLISNWETPSLMVIGRSLHETKEGWMPTYLCRQLMQGTFFSCPSEFNEHELVDPGDQS